MRPYSPGGALNTFASAGNPWEGPRPSAHRLQLGLPGYLILFATLAFVPQRQEEYRYLPSPLVFQLISTHFTATLTVPASLPILNSMSITTSPEVKPWYLSDDFMERLRTLYAQ